MSRRREARLERNFEVKVWGLDRHGKPFMQHAHTLDVTRFGARLVGIECVKVGEIIGIQNGEQKARFKVVWMGRENTPKAGQIGVHCVETDKSIFMTQPQSPREAETFQRTPSETGFEAVKTTRPVRKDMAARRKHPRYPCSGGVELRQQESGPPAWGNLSDISLTGCYVETASTPPVGSMVLFQVRTHNLEVRGRAVVKTSHPGVGIGIAFHHLSQEDQQNLEFLLGMLAGMQEMRPDDKRTFVPADGPAKAVESSPAKSADEQGTGISAQIAHAITQLIDLEQQLVKEKLDPRLIAQFHDAMEHTRQTAWTMQQWADLRSGGNDPFAVLPQLETERMNMLMKLARNVLADLDSSAVDEFGQETNALYTVIQQLHKRLTKIFVDTPEDEGNNTAFSTRKK